MRELEAHQDGSEFSFVLALNEQSEFQGGGTKFLEIDGEPVFRPDRGFATLFSGKNRHCGMAISSGTRYVLAGFLSYADPGGNSGDGIADGSTADSGS